MTALLSFSVLERLGEKNAYGDGKSYRRHFDFLVDGISLFTMANAEKYDLVGTLGWMTTDQDERTVQELLLEARTPVSGERQALFVCAECGNLGCGGITAVVEKIDEQIVWRDFAHENDYDASVTDRVSFEHLGPYTFDLQQYREALNKLLWLRR